MVNKFIKGHYYMYHEGIVQVTGKAYYSKVPCRVLKLGYMMISDGYDTSEFDLNSPLAKEAQEISKLKAVLLQEAVGEHNGKQIY